MDQPFTPELCNIADSMGLALYQRFTPIEASLFLRCPIENIQKLQSHKKLGYIQLPSEQVEFFGYQLLEYLLQQVSNPIQPKQTTQSQPQEKILRIEDVTKMVGLSRSTIWRMEIKGTFPARVALGTRSVGWRNIQIEEWIAKR
jgi:predicted DNA-binding transcriptional regulator AlpA